MSGDEAFRRGRHIVRHPQASRTRCSAESPPARRSDRYMPRASATLAALLWTDYNMLLHGLERFQRGTIQVREDDARKHEMGKRDRVVTAAHILPLLVRYGYSVSASRSRR